MKPILEQRDLLPDRLAVAIGIAVLLGLFIMAQVDYLFFHAAAEGFAILVATLIYVVSTRTYRYSGNNFLLFLGNAYLFVAILDFFHTMTYQGMGVFPNDSANDATQIWIASRYVDALSLFCAPLFLRRRFPHRAVFGLYAAITALLLASILWWQVFPDCFVPGTGLTTFKVASEYVISLLVVGAIGTLYLQRRQLDRSLYLLVAAAMVATILSELSFTLYSDVYGVMNFVGHAFKIVAYYLLYRGIVAEGLQAPYLEIQRLNEDLEQRVSDRTLELQIANRSLENEIIERKDTEERYRELFTSALSAIVVMDAHGRIIDANPQASALSSYPRKELVGMSVFDLAPPDDREQWQATFERLLRAGRGEGEHRLLCRDGRVLQTEYSLSQAGRGRYLAELRDITARKTAEQFRDEYLALVSHDLRSPVTAIVGYAQLLQRAVHKPEDVQKGSELILSNARRINAMIQDLVETARLEAGQLKLYLEPIEVLSFARELKERLEPAIEHGRLRVELPEQTAPAILADRNYLDRMVTNLLTNALKYSDGEVVLTLAREGDQALIAVSDQGPGIDPEALPRVFDRFYRVDGKKKLGGLGLGLYITKLLTEAHGGRVWVESEPGKGCVFRLALPVA